MKRLSSTLLQSLQNPLLPTSWYLVSAVSLSVCNHPELIPQIYHEALRLAAEHRRETPLQVTQKLRESFIKAAAIAGLPKSINALTVLRIAIEDESLLQLPLRPKGNWEQRGRSYFDRIYGKVSERVQGKMERASPQLLQLAIASIYGDNLSYSEILGPKDTSFVVLAGLIPQDVDSQVKGHLKGAITNGATREEVMAVRDVALAVAQHFNIVYTTPVSKL